MICGCAVVAGRDADEMDGTDGDAWRPLTLVQTGKRRAERVLVKIRPEHSFCMLAPSDAFHAPQGCRFRRAIVKSARNVSKEGFEARRRRDGFNRNGPCPSALLLHTTTRT